MIKRYISIGNKSKESEKIIEYLNAIRDLGFNCMLILVHDIVVKYRASISMNNTLLSKTIQMN